MIESNRFKIDLIMNFHNLFENENHLSDKKKKKKSPLKQERARSTPKRVSKWLLSHSTFDRKTMNQNIAKLNTKNPITHCEFQVPLLSAVANAPRD